MVHVPVDDKHTLHSQLQGPLRADGHVVEEAEAGRCVTRGVMAWRADGGECIARSRLAIVEMKHCLRGFQSAAGGEQRRLPRVAIRVDIFAIRGVVGQFRLANKC